ncbi:Phosphoribosylformylglycinamidine synthase, synthetase subunit / Phosphoribosylformylglycinamidine synthase, glutamine amidotransferase subunit [Francisella hispaniensis]|uniref:Phosphoribosylformylglycinamidine synthase, synthetase subunit / Phosphoribosylformylglycinamidine synthase, glutamine amidotransferase subunit n=1 Tax=Francisella hispaniensis TaxID=622488 RepID=F4BHX8_9GAMM|nr:Phosphoribosylformylglycinamidine synthase, synthetase subunit / Phosphoribosylformylglycinamidine synthase, glutamine amidotransferase subunit [Francisella hispaniensis]
MLAQLKSLIKGAENWPIFIKNKSEQFEARASMVEIQESDSIWFADMADTKAPIAVVRVVHYLKMITNNKLCYQARK